MKSDWKSTFASLPALLCLFAAVAEAQEKRELGINKASAADIPAGLKYEDNITYKTVDGQALQLTLFEPLTRKYPKAPFVVFIHGGGWSNGNRFGAAADRINPVIRQLNENGVACATIDYRLAQNEGPHAIDAAADCMEAVAFLVKEAEKYHLDPDRIGIWGASAGGHLALVTGLGATKDYPCDPNLAAFAGSIRCVAAYFPLVSLVDTAMFRGSNFERPGRFRSILGGTIEEKREIAEKLSPTLLLRSDSPPLFLAHGDQDSVLNVINSTTLAALAAERKVPVECLIVKGGEHGFRGKTDPPLDVVMAKTTAFFLRNLAPPDPAK